MKRYLSVAEMIAVEKAADASGHTYEKMMAHAGASLAEEVHDAYSHLNGKQILGLVGSGNNGGDALVAMSLLMQRGWRVIAYLTTRREDDPLLDEFLQSGGRVEYLDNDKDFEKLKAHVKTAEVLVDGLLGTGIRLPLREPVPAVLQTIKDTIAVCKTRPRIVAVDCPSGVDCDSGEAAEECIPADLTVCMAAVKQGLLKLPAYSLLGELVIGDIGLPPGLPEWEKIKRRVLDHTILRKIPPRPLGAHKGTFGTALVVAGSKSYAGAALLAGKAAFRSGVGWVNMAVTEDIQMGLVGAFPEATWMPLPSYHGVINEDASEVVKEGLTKETALLIGPGMGQEFTTQRFLELLLSPDLPPVVIDADGLKLLAKIEKWWEKLPAMAVLTPHPGEMSVLCGQAVDEIQEDRVATAEEWAKRWGHVVVLKGAFTIVAGPGGETAVLPVATPALARAGTGDVLAGIILSLREQGMDAFEAACAGVWLHAEAGKLAAGEVGSTAGVLAGDLIEILPWLLPA
jgi:NAD(P)H-hydrate epimerase